MHKGIILPSALALRHEVPAVVTVRSHRQTMFAKFSRLIDPFVLALLAVLLLASLFPPRGEWVARVDLLADIGIFALFFLHGAKLSRQALSDGARHWRLHSATLAMTFVMFPVAGLALALSGIVPQEFATGILFLSFLPSTVQSSIAFTSIARGNVAAAVCAASFSNVIGIVLTPALVALFITSQGDGIGWDAIQSIIIKLLLPFVLGHLSRPWTAAFVARHKAILGRLDRGSILLIVYSAFGAAIVEGVLQSLAVRDLAILILVCCGLLGVIMAIATGFARLAHFNREDAIVLLFCGSKKSLASGAPMAGVLFLPEQTGLILLPVIVFHQMQLMACAVLAPYLARNAVDEDGSAGPGG